MTLIQPFATFTVDSRTGSASLAGGFDASAGLQSTFSVPASPSVEDQCEELGSMRSLCYLAMSLGMDSGTDPLRESSALLYEGSVVENSGLQKSWRQPVVTRKGAAGRLEFDLNQPGEQLKEGEDVLYLVNTDALLCHVV